MGTIRGLGQEGYQEGLQSRGPYPIAKDFRWGVPSVNWIIQKEGERNFGPSWGGKGNLV